MASGRRDPECSFTKGWRLTISLILKKEYALFSDFKNASQCDGAALDWRRSYNVGRGSVRQSCTLQRPNKASGRAHVRATGVFNVYHDQLPWADSLRGMWLSEKGWEVDAELGVYSGPPPPVEI